MDLRYAYQPPRRLTAHEVVDLVNELGALRQQLPEAWAKAEPLLTVGELTITVAGSEVNIGQITSRKVGGRCLVQVGNLQH